MIEDPELRALFNAETEEHLQILENGLLQMESEPQDSTLLEDIFRSAHSLKGAAGMLGVSTVETLAHHFEDELGAVRSGRIVMTSALADRLYRGLDAMRRLAQEAGGGEPSHVDVAAVLEQLRGTPTPVAVEAVGGNAATAKTQPILENPISTMPLNLANRVAEPLPSRPEIPEEGQPQTSPATFKIETIRVEPQKLDALMTLAGEMTVTTTRIGRSLTALEDLRALWEEWGRDVAALRTSGAVASVALVSSPSDGERRQLARFQTRQLERLERLGDLLDNLERAGSEEVTRLGLVASALDESIRNLRLLPFSTLFNLFPRMVRDLSQELGKEVRLEMEGASVAADKQLLEAMKDPLMHLIRNAIDHGIEEPDVRESYGKPRAATLWLCARQSGAHVVVEVKDDGRGLNREAIRWSALEKGLAGAEELAALSEEEVQMLIFSPGFSTSTIITDLSGRGVGLDVVRTNIERLKGTITVDSNPGYGCTFRLQAPITLATTRVLLAQVAQRSYAVPVEAVQEIFPVAASSIFSLEGRATIRWEDRPMPVAQLADLLELREERAEPDSERLSSSDLRPCVLLSIGTERLGLFVDALVEEQEVILKPFGGLLQRVRNVSGATVLSTGEICMVLNPSDLIKSAQKLRALPSNAVPTVAEERRKVVLLADDSITTRTQERRILESAGYEVVTAVDGVDAFNKLGARLFDAVVSDVEMPNMDGLTLASRIRLDAKYKELPIILVTSLASDADRKRGVEVGANAYITKGTFDQTVLLSTLRRLV